METMNHEYYVSLEVAKLLKECGFKWFINTTYRDGVLVHQKNLLCDNFNGKRYENNTAYEFFSAPTLEVAQRWLREVKGIYIGIITLENKHAVTNSDGWTFHYEYGKPMFYCDIQNERCETIATLDDSFDTYEEAQEAGIKKTLEIILEKGE